MADTPRDGGPAFPMYGADKGITKRDYYRAHAPVTVADVLPMLEAKVEDDGSPFFVEPAGYFMPPAGYFMPRDLRDWAEVFKLMAILRDQYATAMLALDGEKEDG